MKLSMRLYNDSEDYWRTRVFSTAHDPAADALYRSILQTHKVTETWLKEIS